MWSLVYSRACKVPQARGSLPNVQQHAQAVVEAARLRLIDLADPAVDVLRDLISSSGTSDQIRLAAAKEVLDRAGVRGGVDISVEVEHKVDPGVEVARRLKEIRDRVQDHPDEIVIEEEDDDDGTGFDIVE